MKYKCIKDFWLNNESEENGNIPAFKAGDVYDFDVFTSIGGAFTLKNNQGYAHGLMEDELNAYFELVADLPSEVE